jgi:hypothetical protein
VRLFITRNNRDIIFYLQKTCNTNIFQNFIYANIWLFYSLEGSAVEVIVWQLDLQLPVQSVPITIKVVSSNPAHFLDTTLCDKDYQWLAVGRRFSLGTPVSSTNKTGRHDIAEILLKVAFNTIILILTTKYIHFAFTTHFNLQMVSDVTSL